MSNKALGVLLNLRYLSVLRQLVDQQQFGSLQTEARQYHLESGDPQALPLLALAHAHLGERDEAHGRVAEAQARISELDQDARVDLAAVYCLLGRIDEAVTLLLAVLKVQAEHALALARLAWCRLQQGQPVDACSLYQRSAALAPHRLPVWMAVARLQLVAADHPAAQQALDIAISRFEATLADLPEGVVNEFTAQLRGLQLEIWVACEALAQAEQWLDERRDGLPEDQWCVLVLGYSTLLAGQERHAESEEALRKGLTHYPQNLDLISQLAELAQLQGRTMQAVQLIRRSIRLASALDEPQQGRLIGLWVRLSTACLQQLDEQAAKAADKAVELVAALQVSEGLSAPMIRHLSLQAKNAQAQVESQAQNFDVAEAQFRAVLEEAPHFVPALQGLGQQQMQRGRIDEAIVLFESIKQIDPAKGYSSLINARRFPEDDLTLEKIERVARQPSLEGSVRSGLLLQLAAAWEKRKDHDKAFALAVEANNASKKRLGYDPKMHRNQCARTRHAFSQALFEHRRECGVDSSLPVFVLGMPRSGTTLVEQILAGHSQIFGAGELGVIPSRIAGLNRWERHTGSGRHYPDCIDDLNPQVTTGIANGILDELRELAESDNPGVRHVVDKLPHNFENVGFIKFLFPNARIISVRRDPRDIAISNYFTDYQAKHGGMGFAYDLGWIGEQLADHNLMMHHWDQLFPGEILEVNYEDVVEDLEGSARRMLDYIGVDWEPRVLSFNELERPVKTASVWQVRQPVYKTSKAKWRRYQGHLAPLTQGTNAKIHPDPITDMVTLPEAGFLTDGVASFRADDLDSAERSFKKMLHHNPEHAACTYMLGLIYCRKNRVADAVELLEKAHQQCPWQQEWRDNLIQAYGVTGDTDKAEALIEKLAARGQEPANVETDAQADPFEGDPLLADSASDQTWAAGTGLLENDPA
ncbi:MAG: tetratricopeptide (TPR) repeat protein [Motiliproteus sp.]|jgi:tetratricopeptide (TPR) repeat protein